MSETLGSLCDKLTIVKLKQWHSTDAERLESLTTQAVTLQSEIDTFVTAAVLGDVPLQKLTFAANKVFKREGNEVAAVNGGIGDLFAELARVNCELWHEQEKVYDFAAVPADQKDAVVKALAHLNLQRNQCIDAIDRTFRNLVQSTRQTDGGRA